MRKEVRKGLAQAGFTLFELVIVMVILGILAVFAIPKVAPTEMTLQSAANLVLTDLRHTQALSMTSGQRYRLVKTAANTFQILNQAGTAIVLPTGGTTQTFTSGITFSSLSNMPNDLLAFGIDGTPYVDTAIPGTSLSSTAIITLSNGSTTRTVQISPQTGYGVLV